MLNIFQDDIKSVEILKAVPGKITGNVWDTEVFVLRITFKDDCFSLVFVKFTGNPENRRKVLRKLREHYGELGYIWLNNKPYYTLRQSTYDELK